MALVLDGPCRWDERSQAPHPLSLSEMLLREQFVMRVTLHAYTQLRVLLHVHVYPIHCICIYTVHTCAAPYYAGRMR